MNLTSKQTASTAFNNYATIDQVAALMQGPHTYEYFDVKDNFGSSLGVFDIVQTSDLAHPYLAVSHRMIGTNKFEVDLNWSTDLVTWARIGPIDSNFASQPTIRPLMGGGYLVAHESDPNNQGAYIRIKHYLSLGSLLANQPDSDVEVTRTPGALNDGTPSFRQIKSAGTTFDALSLQITHHVYFDQPSGLFPANHDREGFTTWNWVSPGAFNVNNNEMFTVFPLNVVIPQQGVAGNIGGRDSFSMATHRYFVVEGETAPGDFSSWNLYLVQEVTNTVRRLQMAMPDGVARSIGNPKISFVTMPDGAPAMLGTAFIFGKPPGATLPPRSHLWIQVVV